MQAISVPSLTDQFGFRMGAGSVHTSRTMMLAELTRALERLPADAPTKSYTAAIVDENLLGKRTRSTRQRTAKRLIELYALDPRCPIFRVFRSYWSGAAEGRAMLAFLLGCDRDPILRECTPQVLGIPQDQVGTPPDIETWLGEKYPGRFRPTTQCSTAKNLASTWSQAGILRGTTTKHRSQSVVTPVVTAYALLLGYLGGLRGGRLLDSSWATLLDRPHTAIIDSAIAASKQGWLR